ncbi:MAG: 3-methyladenine glycosylase [Acidobacteria bacterium]|jgi:DNA-3-methyladenine glycosylase|nr:3-methyladenine glycosylase [Acidobacteriota bacterium]
MRGLLLRRAFYERPTLTVASDLLGKVLVHRSTEGVTAGAIVEAEAYIGEDDPACHASAGLTRRTATLFGPPGHAYVYLNYGIHFLFNVVTEADGHPAAVLVRALEPLDGLPLMRRRRAGDRRSGAVPDHELCRGPGALARAMGITLAHNQADLCAVRAPRLSLEDRGMRPEPVGWSPRVGVSAGADRPWRCYVVGHPSVSGPRPAVAERRAGR